MSMKKKGVEEPCRVKGMERKTERERDREREREREREHACVLYTYIDMCFSI